MRDRSNDPSTIITAGVALIVVGLMLVPVVWWLAIGVQAGIETEATIQDPRTDRDVLVYTTMLRILALVIALAAIALVGAGGVIGWKGVKRLRR